MNFGLMTHERGYQISCDDALLTIGTALSGIVFAKRHWELANNSEFSHHRLGHRLIAILEVIPLFGAVAGLIERIVVFVLEKLYKKENSTTKELSSPLQIKNNRKRVELATPSQIQDIPIGQVPPITMISADSFNLQSFNYHEFEVNYHVYNKFNLMKASAWKDLNSDNSVTVGLDQFYIHSPENPPLLLKTFGLGPCIGLILFHSQTKKTLLAHCFCSNPTLDHNLNKLLSQFADEKNPLAESRAILLGGRNNVQQSIDIANILISNLKNNSVKLETTYLFPQIINKKYTFTPFCSFDPETGSVTIHYNIFEQGKLKIS